MSLDEKGKVLESIKTEVDQSAQKGSEASLLTYFLIGVSSAVIITSIYLLAAYKTKQMRLATLGQQIEEEVNTPLKNLASDKKQSDIVLKQLETLTTTISGRIKLSKLMGDLIAKQYKKSRWDTFTYQGDTISISGQTDNYEDAAKAVMAMRLPKMVQDVKISSATGDDKDKKVNFSVSLKVNPDLYRAAALEAKSTPTGTATATPGT